MFRTGFKFNEDVDVALEDFQCNYCNIRSGSTTKAEYVQVVENRYMEILVKGLCNYHVGTSQAIDGVGKYFNSREFKNYKNDLHIRRIMKA